MRRGYAVGPWLPRSSPAVPREARDRRTAATITTTAITTAAPATAQLQAGSPEACAASDSPATSTASLASAASADAIAASSARSNAYSTWVADEANTFAPDTWTLAEDGTASFTWTVTIDQATLDAVSREGATLAAFTTGAGGVVQPANELAVDLSFAEIEPEPTPEPTPDPEPSPDPEPTPDEDLCTVIDGGSLEWGVKQSFRSYITGPIAGGTWTTSGVADNGGIFAWDGGEGWFDADATEGLASYAGSVRFTGHGGDLDLTLANPQVVVTSATSGQLLLDVDGLSLEGEAIGGDDITFATLDLDGALMVSDGAVTLSGAGATLTAAGSEAFGGFYEAGTALDPVSAELPLEETTDCTTGHLPGGDGTGDGSGNGSGTGSTGGSNDGAGVGSTDGTGSATGSTTGGATSAEQECVANGVSSGSLTWGVKSSFRSYISGPIAQGSVSLNGTSQNGGGAYVWNGGSGAYNAETGQGRASYSGSVHFTGHGGQLDLLIANPSVRVTVPTSAHLIANVTSKGLDGPGVNASGVVIATLSGTVTASGETVSASGMSASLTAAGAEAFGGFYQAGTAMDPVSFTIGLGGEVECTSETGTLASTGADTGDLALAALGVMLLGGAALVMHRRRVEA